MEELELQHGWLLELVLFALIFGAVYLLLKSLSHKTFRWVFPIVNALLLTIFTVKYSGRFPVLLKEQTVLFASLHHFQSQLHQNQSINAFLGGNRLLLVDASHDLELIPDPSLNATWRANQLITDRLKLTHFLKSLAQDSARMFVDMVVCDLTFTESASTVQDSALQAALNALNAQKHLLIARSEQTEHESMGDYLAIDTHKLAGGSVDITKYYDGTFFTYNLFDQMADSMPSLPYVLYDSLKSDKECSTKSITKPNGINLGISSTFVPDFWIDNEDVSREAEMAPESSPSWWQRLVNPGDARPDTLLQEASGRLRDNLFYLGQVTDRSKFNGQNAFLDQLHDNYQHCKRNIVFIGIFEDPERDMHETLVGPMHGSILLLNMFMNLLAGSHLIGIGYVIYLMAGFWGVGYLLIQEHYSIPKHDASNNQGKWAEFTNWFWEMIDTFMQKIVNNRAELLAFLILLGAISFFNHLINLVIIGVYLATITEVFEKLYHRKSGHE